MTFKNQPQFNLLGCIAFLGLMGLNASPLLAKDAELSLYQNHRTINQEVENFIKKETLGLPGQVEIKVNAIDPRVNLTRCDFLHIFLPSGSRLWGKTTVGVSCNQTKESSAWTIYVQATVAVNGDYLIAAAPLSQGEVITEFSVTKQTGDLTQLPTGICSNAAQIIGSTMKSSVMAGFVMRQDLIARPPAVKVGQSVIISSAGEGFQVTSGGRALSNAVDGQVVQVKLNNGQIVSGVARAGGFVDVTL